MRWLIIYPLAVLLALTGCTTPKQVIREKLPDIVLASACDREPTRWDWQTIHLPPGRYTAVLRDARGVYYKPAGTIVMGERMVLEETYLYVETATGRQGLWTGKAVTIWFKEPISVVVERGG